MIKIRFKSKFAINRETISYQVVKYKVLNWTSKGR